MRLLLLEDDSALQSRLVARLAAEGYQVEASGDGAEGLYLAQEYPFDAAVIDIGLPQLSGLEVIRRLRAGGRTLPVLVLTARGRWQDKVEGLEAGADDYLVKPFEIEELLARLRALLRRAGGAPAGTLCAGPLQIDPAAQQASLSGQAIDLTAFEYRLLEHLTRQRSRVVSKDELTDILYPHDEDRDSNVIEVLIGRLRRKLDPDGLDPPIETLRGRGYRLRWGQA